MRVTWRFLSWAWFTWDAGPVLHLVCAAVKFLRSCYRLSAGREIFWIIGAPDDVPPAPPPGAGRNSSWWARYSADMQIELACHHPAGCVSAGIDFFFFRMNKTLSPTGGTWVIFVFRYILLVKGNEGRGENDPLGNRKRVTGCDVQ